MICILLNTLFINYAIWNIQRDFTLDFPYARVSYGRWTFCKCEEETTTCHMSCDLFFVSPAGWFNIWWSDRWRCAWKDLMCHMGGKPFMHKGRPHISLTTWVASVWFQLLFLYIICMSQCLLSFVYIDLKQQIWYIIKWDACKIIYPYIYLIV